MKTFLLLSLFVVQAASAQTIRYVDNNPGRAANTAAFVYSTLQAAHNAATAGDIIYVVGSPNPYTGGCTVTKQLRFIGTGYLLGNNPQTQASANASDLNGAFETIAFNSGSSGSIIEGMSSVAIRIDNTSNITVRRNRIPGALNISTSSSNILAEQNFITGILSVRSFTGAIIIRNNILTRPFTLGLSIENHSTNVSVINNTFYGAELSMSSLTTTTASITNNIFSGSIITLSGASVIFGNNILEGVSLANNSGLNVSGTNNITNTVTYPFNITGTSGVNVSDAILFGATPNLGIDNNFLLTPTNPARGNGTGGVDIGATGGATPYVLSGMPPVPAVYFFTTPGSGTTTLSNVEVRIKSNN